MNRLTACIKFQMKSMLKGSLIFMAIYIAVSVALLCIFTISSDISTGGSSTSGFHIGSSIFIFVYVIAAYKEMFNYLLMFGNTRKNILLSSIVTSAAMSVLFSAASVLAALADAAVPKILGLGSGSISILNLIYKNTGLFSESIWLAGFFFLICSFSLLYGALAYKFGNVFITVFWVCFGLSFVGIPVLLDMNSFKVLAKALTSFFSLGSEHGILLAPVNFVAASVIICILTFLASRRQPQSA